MPELQTVTFTGTHADANKPVYNGNGVWTLYSEDTPGAIGASATATLGSLYTITKPANTTIYIFPLDSIVGAPKCAVVSAAYLSDGEVYLNITNVSGGGETPTGNQPIAHMLILPDTQCKLTHTVFTP